jgi:hypothetical protein
MDDTLSDDEYAAARKSWTFLLSLSEAKQTAYWTQRFSFKRILSADDFWKARSDLDFRKTLSPIRLEEFHKRNAKVEKEFEECKVSQREYAQWKRSRAHCSSGGGSDFPYISAGVIAAAFLCD